MLYTSGTTGRPKGVKRARQPSLGADAHDGRRRGHGARPRRPGPAPRHRAAVPRRPARLRGHRPRQRRRAGADAALGRGAVPRPHRGAGDPQQPRRARRCACACCGCPRRSGPPSTASSLSTVLHGAAPIAPSVKHQMIEWWGPVLTEYWGSTEGGVFTLVDSAAWLTKPGTVGKALPELRGVRGRRRGRAAARRARWARSTRATSSPTRCSSTTRRRRRPRPPTSRPGTFTMGDVGHVDDDGFVFLSDRAANMIISGGVNIYPAEIEQVLIDHPAVADVAVFGIPDDEWGEQVKAAVELAAGYEPSDRAGGRAARCSPAPAGRLQGAAVGRLRGGAAPPPHRQALHPPAPRQVLGGPRRRCGVVEGDRERLEAADEVGGAVARARRRGRRGARSGRRSSSWSSITEISRRARLAPRQKCGPKPKATCSFGVRAMSKRNGSSNTSSSRLADG